MIMPIQNISGIHNNANRKNYGKDWYQPKGKTTSFSCIRKGILVKVTMPSKYVMGDGIIPLSIREMIDNPCTEMKRVLLNTWGIVVQYEGIDFPKYETPSWLVAA